MEENNKMKGKSGYKSTIAISVCIVIIVALVSILCYMFFFKDKEVENDQPQVAATIDGRGILVTPENVEEILNAEKVDADYFETNMTNEWHFKNGTADMSTVYLKNEASNDKTFYFDLILSENEKVIYSSPYIPVGAEMTQFDLSTIPEKGTHKGTIKYHFVDDEYKEVSDVSIAVTLYIE